jgi:hypothetical protein
MNMKKLIAILLLLVGTANAQVREVLISPTVDTAAYASGDTVGGLQTISVTSCTGPLFEIIGIATIDDAGQSNTRDFTFFKPSSTGLAPTGTFSDNNATAPTKADLLLASPPVQIASTDCFVFSGKAICSIGSLASPIATGVTFDSRRKYYLAVTTRAADDFVTNADFFVKLFIRCL